MPLNLNPRTKDRLKQLLRDQLPSVEVNNKSFMDWDSSVSLFTLEGTLPEHGSSIDLLHDIIGESPIYIFLYGLLSKELNDNQTYDSSKPLQRLIDLDDYSDVAATSERLIDDFESLPWQYRFTVDINPSLLKLFSDSPAVYEISDSIRIVKPDDTFIDDHPLQTPGETPRGIAAGFGLGLGLLGSYIPPQWKTDTVYLQISTDGFVGKYVSTGTEEAALTDLKTFLGLAIALRLLKVESKHHPITSKYNFIIHKNVSSNWVADSISDISEETSKTIRDLAFNDLDSKLDTDEKQIGWIKLRLGGLSTVFRERDKSEKLLLAGQWFFDSYSGSNELLSFVQTMVAMEILLGDKSSSDIVGLGELLRNRCAYLVGKTHDQRKDILEDFKKIYDIRSKIVHRGKSRLTSDERRLFKKLQWLCRRVIAEEIELLK